MNKKLIEGLIFNLGLDNTEGNKNEKKYKKDIVVERNWNFDY